MGVRISVSKTVEEAAQNEVPNMIHFTDGEVEDGEHRILLNGKDYTGVKTVKESTKDGYINVDGTDVPVHGLDYADQQEINKLIDIFSTNQQTS